MAFHVPEGSRDTMHPQFGTTHGVGNYGAFHFESPEPGWTLSTIATDGNDPAVPAAQGWEHVSVHAHSRGRLRTPSWKEMAFVKGVFWDDDDVVIQYHPRKSEYVNLHPNVLHLWRATHVEIPTPPPFLV
jgi:hypothetical protein